MQRIKQLYCKLDLWTSFHIETLSRKKNWNIEFRKIGAKKSRPLFQGQKNLTLDRNANEELSRTLDPIKERSTTSFLVG